MPAFDFAQFDGILKKMSEFNSTLLSDPDKNHLSLSGGDVPRLNGIVMILKDTSHYHSSKLSDADVAMILKLLKSWPVDVLFPDIVIELIKKVTASPLPANLLTSLGAVTNLLKNACFNEWLLIHRSEILDAFSSCCSSSNKNVQISYATLILNYAVLLEGQSQVLSAVLEMAEAETVDSDSRFRALVAIGSLVQCSFWVD